VAGSPAIDALRAAGVPFTQHSYRHDPAHPSFGWEAAQSLGLDPRQVFKTLIWRAGSEPVIAIVAVTDTVDAKALARAAGARKAAPLDRADAERVTGYRIGGISPFGLRTALPTYLDVRARDVEMMYVSAGLRGHELCLTPNDLSAVTGASLVKIAKAGPSTRRSMPRASQ